MHAQTRSQAPDSSGGNDDGIDPDQVYTVQAHDVRSANQDQIRLSYKKVNVSGHGSFGVVVKVQLIGGGEGFAALKVTKQDRRFKNRELQIMQNIAKDGHPNIINLRYYWYQQSQSSADEVYLNLVLDYIPETIYRSYRSFTKRRQQFPEILIKVYMHQLFRALSYLHCVLNICHRDLKPHNLMTDPDRGILTLIDFGSAKVLRPGDLNVAYTCSRYYRAPELIFGSTKYTHTIDMWSSGCILGELLQGSVFFPGNSGIDQLVEIIKILGTPSRTQINSMNPSYASHSFPQIKPVALSKILTRASPEALELLSKLLAFDPTSRITACEAMTLPFFDELRNPNTRLPNGKELPELFDFSHEELSVRPDLIRRLVPPHKEKTIWEKHRLDVNNFEAVDLVSCHVHLD